MHNELENQVAAQSEIPSPAELIPAIEPVPETRVSAPPAKIMGPVKTDKPVPENNAIKEGDVVLLWFGEEETTYLVEVTKGKRMGIHCGKPLPVDAWMGCEFGTKVICEHGEAYL